MSQTPKRVLVVDDEENQRSAVSRMIERWGYETATACDGVEALQRMREVDPDAIITDLMMPGMDGMQLLERLRDDEGDRAPSVIVLTGFGTVENALTTVHEYGAFWFVEKPIRPRAFRVLLERAVARRRLARYSDSLERQLSTHGVFGKLSGRSKPMQEVYFLIRQGAPARTNVLITGESGTGKELAARAIHDASPRRSGPFVALNCAALPESLIESELFGHERGAFTGAVTRRAGCFELASGGTVFLDEIGDMPLALQSKLLRVLENRTVRRIGAAQETPVDVRVVAATNRVLEGCVKQNTFREDLFFRLSVLQIHMPALRERMEDLPDLATAILEDLHSAQGLPRAILQPEVLAALAEHDWPGNVRELRNVLERALVLAGGNEVTTDHLPSSFQRALAPKPQRSLAPAPSVTIGVGTTLEQAEQEIIAITLAYTNNNRTRAAELLGIDPKTLYNKLRGRGAAGV